MSEIAQGTFLHLAPSDSAIDVANCIGSETERLACEGRLLASNMTESSKIPVKDEGGVDATLQWLRKAQRMLSGAASNYDLKNMSTGILLAGFAVLTVGILSFSPAYSFTLPNVAFGITISAYGVLHFASSYVEEEQQFWYWALPGWLLYLFIKECVISSGLLQIKAHVSQTTQASSC